MEKHSFEPGGLEEEENSLDAFLTLDEAARELGTTRQGIVQLIERARLSIRRVQRSGRNLSGLTRAELEHLRSPNPARPGPARLGAAGGREDDASLRWRALAISRWEEIGRLQDRLQSVEAVLASAAADREEARQEAASRAAALEEALDGARKLESELTGAHEELERLQEQFGGVEATAAETAARRAEAEREAEAARARLSGLEGELAEAARVVEQRDADVEELRKSNESALRQVELAGDVERTSQRYLDKLERELQAARERLRDR